MTSVFDDSRSYYVVLIKDTSVAIYLWRGLSDGDFKDTNRALTFFTDTCFKTIFEQKGTTKRKGSVIHQLKGLDLSAGIEEKKKQFDDLGITKSNTRKDDLLSFGGGSSLIKQTGR